jgi:hypothetical protein
MSSANNAVISSGVVGNYGNCQSVLLCIPLGEIISKSSDCVQTIVSVICEMILIYPINDSSVEKFTLIDEL